MATLTRISDIETKLPVFRCAECGDLFAHAVVVSKDKTRNSFDQLGLIGAIDEQKPRHCPSCGAKNKAGS